MIWTTGTLIRSLFLSGCAVCLCSVVLAKPATPPNPFFIGQQQIVIEFNPGFTAAEQQRLIEWIKTVSTTATRVYGTLPLNTTYIELTPQRRANEPVPFGSINRSNRQGIRFYVNPSYPLQNFIDDWTAYHEFSHLMIPYPGADDIWFSEGLASYYQNILMSRAGICTALEAWQKIYAGFLRAANDTNMQYLTLQALSPRMHATRSFMRVYWSGALYFLKVDIALRKQQQSLDSVLAKLKDCCVNTNTRWSALRLIQQMDSISKSTLFSDHYRAMINKQTIGDIESLWSDLGLTLQHHQLQPSTKNNPMYLHIMRQASDKI